MTRYVLLNLCFFVLLLSCSSQAEEKKNETPTLRLFAASSLQNVMEELVDSFEHKQNTKVKLNFAASGTLARQIEMGAQADVFISANKSWVKHLQKKNLIQEDKISTVAKNTLVLVANTKSKIKEFTVSKQFSLKKLLHEGRLAMGDPSYVPAGKYAQQALQFYGWWENTASRLLLAKDVRSALMYVELGECELGLVYATDAIQSKKVKRIGEFPNTSHDEIGYVATVCSQKPIAAKFWKYMQTKAAHPVWKKHGFTQPASEF